MLIDLISPGCLWDAPGRVFLYCDEGFQAASYGIVPRDGHVRVTHQYGCVCDMSHFDERGCTVVDLSAIGDGTLAAALPALMGCQIADRRNEKSLRELLGRHGLELVTIRGEALIEVRSGDETMLIATRNCD